MPDRIRLDFELYIIDIIDKYVDCSNLTETRLQMIDCINKIFLEFEKDILF